VVPRRNTVFIRNLNLICVSPESTLQQQQQQKNENWVALHKTICESSLLSADLDTENISQSNKALGTVKCMMTSHEAPYVHNCYHTLTKLSYTHAYGPTVPTMAF
jgi:hypothetical protein